jgi:hypothetical protein
MIYGVYLRNKRKGTWRMVSAVVSAELAVSDSQSFLRQAYLEGHDDAEVTIQTFETSFYIPEYISKIKDQKLIYN